VETTLDLLDSEILVIEKVVKKLNSYKNQMGLLEFGDAVEEEFGEAGYKAYVVWHFPDGTTIPHASLEFTLTVAVGRMAAPDPEITIVDRITPIASFDHERMSWEVQRDILDIDTPGAIGRSGLITPPKSVAFVDKKS
jgi:hypothetical protein